MLYRTNLGKLRTLDLRTFLITKIHERWTVQSLFGQHTHTNDRASKNAK